MNNLSFRNVLTEAPVTTGASVCIENILKENPNLIDDCLKNTTSIKKVINVLSLCSGIAGAELAAKAAGMNIMGFCEMNPYSIAVLNKHYPNIPVFRYVEDLDYKLKKDERALLKYGIVPGKIQAIIAGWPCQDYSDAGKKKGRLNKRGRIFDHVLSIAKTLRIPIFIGENVRGSVDHPDGVTFWIKELAKAGYKAKVFQYTARDFSANHKRERVFIVGWHAGWGGRVTAFPKFPNIVQSSSPYWSEAGLQKSCVSRVKNGVPSKLDAIRLTQIGNAISPAQIYPLLKCIANLYSCVTPPQ